MISTVHDTFDTRIFYKQIPSLAEEFDVTYFTPSTEEPGVPGAVPLPKSRSKLGRLGTHVSLWKALRRVRADLYLLHDPELLPLGIVLKCLGARVVWDMHEDTYNDIKTKGYLGPASRVLLSEAYRVFQTLARWTFDGFVLAEDAYQSYFPASVRTCVVHNYPMLDRLLMFAGTPKEEATFVYIGSISENRGIRQLLKITSQLKETLADVRLILIGPFADRRLEQSVREEIDRRELSANVTVMGAVKNVDAYPLLARCKVGVALLLPEPNFCKALPTKMFEYMALGLPVVVSDFPLWKEIVDQRKAGYAVDPNDVSAAVQALLRLLTDQERYARMSEQARATAEAYSWEPEGIALCKFIHEIVGDRGSLPSLH